VGHADEADVATVAGQSDCQSQRGLGAHALQGGVGTASDGELQHPRRRVIDADLEADVLSAVSGDELAPHELVLEITESALMDNPDQTCRLLERLRACGVKTAIDDFGTGYSSLGHHNRLPVAMLKIDRSFIRNITVDADSLAITASVIELARSMGLATIAEGVETIEQLALLQGLGCWAAQGFLWSPALAPEALAGLINRLPDRRFAVRLAETSS
jgi:EAL domain-containing protein (putative c-di-GMP-specific phosphodiesterase class I)